MDVWDSYEPARGRKVLWSVAAAGAVVLVAAVLLGVVL